MTTDNLQQEKKTDDYKVQYAAISQGTRVTQRQKRKKAKKSMFSRVARVQLGTHTNAGPELHGCNSGEHGFLEVFVCMAVWLSVCRYGCLLDCMSVCLSGVMSTCLHGCMPVWLSVCMSIYMSACTYVCLADCMSACNFDPATLHMHHMQGS